MWVLFHLPVVRSLGRGGNGGQAARSAAVLSDPGHQGVEVFGIVLNPLHDSSITKVKVYLNGQVRQDWSLMALQP